MFAAPRNTVQVRNAQKNARRRNGQSDTLSMLQISADDHNDTRYTIALQCIALHCIFALLHFCIFALVSCEQY